jgi:hypothetical protein
MALRVPIHEPSSLRFMEATGCPVLCVATWEPQVAYASQFMDRVARGHQGAETIKSRLCSAGGFHADEWDLPPKPKWMRWKTYNRMVERFDRYEAMVEEGLLEALKQLGSSRNISD